MKICVVGAHGQIAMLLHPLLKSNGHEVYGIIRNPDHAEDLRRAGAVPVICDIEKEKDISAAVGNVDAVVFAAGAGPGSGADRKWTVDRDGALKLIEASKKNGITRYIMVSAMNPETPRGNDVFQVYLKAKAEADQALRESGLEYTILRPGRLLNDVSCGRISLDESLEPGEICRVDVAGVIAEVLDTPASAGCQWDLVRGDIPIETAVQKAVKARKN
ncbi:SDR family oxidoreductase [Balneolaceae bacterium ANBcel3]|nr:SDR family oxidoreductase [Balneolaceae bacterium ANBcel3]